MTVNAEVASWWKGNAKSDSSSLPSMMFEDNASEIDSKVIFMGHEIVKLL